MQSAGGLVRSFGELSAEFQHGHDSFESGLFQVGMLIDGNSSTVVFDGHGAVVIDLDGNGGGESCHGFVDGVIDDFADEVMESSARRIADAVLLMYGAGPKNYYSRTCSWSLRCSRSFAVLCLFFWGFICAGQCAGGNRKLFGRFGQDFAHDVIIT